jgi:hypothetical protein
MPSNLFSSSSSGIIVSASGAIGASVAAASWMTISLLTGTGRMVFTTSWLLPRSASDWMSALPTRASP